MRQRKLNSDLIIVLDKSEEDSCENDEKNIHESESSDSVPVSPHIQFSQAMPVYLNTNMSMHQGMAMYLEQEMAYCKLKKD